ncbi:MAG: hypothetical protein LBL74_04535 [Bacteroidales bacterium]|jgi:hypothetical protein|nr:hypothetical protein [Bacteroidales bacterium]
MNKVKNGIALFISVVYCYACFGQQHLIQGKFMLQIQNNVVYILSEDEDDEYIEKKLLLYDLTNNLIDTLVSNTYNTDVVKVNENEIIYTDGNKIVKYNVMSKQRESVYQSKSKYLDIIDIMFNNKCYFFVQDYDNFKILLYELKENKETLLSTFDYKDELESTGLLSYYDKNNCYFKLRGILHSYNFDKKATLKLDNRYIYDFVVSKDKIYYVFSNKNNPQNKCLGQIDKNFTNQQIIIDNLNYYFWDYLFIYENTIYVYYSQKNKAYKIINNELLSVSNIPLFKNDKLSILFIDEKHFRIDIL